MNVSAIAKGCPPAPLETIKHWFLNCDEEENNIASRILDHRSQRIQGTDGGESSIRLYAARIFTMLNFDWVATIAENDSEMRSIYAGHFNSLNGIREDVVLKVSGVTTRCLASVKSLGHLKMDSLKSINECLWYQQILSELADTGNAMIPEILDVRVLRQPEPKKLGTKEYSYVCILMRRYETSLHDWLSHGKITDETRVRISRMIDNDSPLPLAPGAGGMLLTDPIYRPIVNRIIRRILLRVVCVLHTLQERHAFVHHDLHTRNVLLRFDSRDGVVPVIMDLENAEGLCRRDGSDTLEYVSGAHSYSFVNALTRSYDCYRFFSDILFLLRQNRLIGFVDGDTVGFLRRCVQSYFDEESAEREWKTSSSRFQRRMWQPAIVETLCDPVDLLRWNGFISKELDVAMQEPCAFLNLISGVGNGYATFLLGKKNTVELRALRAFFSLGDSIAWIAMARNLKLFIPDDFFLVVTHHANLCDVLYKVVKCMVYEWDEVKCGQSWSWNLSESSCFKGARFARLHMIQTVILAYLKWLYDRCAAVPGDENNSDMMGDIGQFSKYRVELAKRRIYPQEHQKVIVTLLSHIAPPEYTTRYLHYIGCSYRIPDYFDTTHMANSFVGNLIQRGALRCLPVPCINISIQDRKHIDNSDMLHDLAQISMDPRLYLSTSAHMFLPLFVQTQEKFMKPTRLGKRLRNLA
ncbi:hypothetical protein CYMTET_3004 [Cymbomonas tetramitiformis]|uniref:Protein kinase domain-containing protein n=1 Tax=Cymbomonas tetramitiformis TaxID=36881 RepID=A0AAE0H467_9CHLO|nr:hypothetical protein CYMTET_3004 [Cymbomonas tetramitiformis]